jgi:adenylate kinase
MTVVSANRVMLLGAPGAGKGTVAKGLSDRFGLTHVSTGDMLRKAVAAGSELGREVQSILAAGHLVPDETMIKLLRDRVQEADCRRPDGTPRFLLDGFPRTSGQAEALLRNGLAPEVVIYLEVEDDVIVRRLCGRRTCPGCGNPHHVDFAPPAVSGVCDRCGVELVQRPDDQEEPIRRRLAVFGSQTELLVEWYGDRIERVDGSLPADVVLATVVERLSGTVGPAST